MSDFEIINGVFDDFWVALEATFRIAKKEMVSIDFYLPESEGASDKKVAITDGNKQSIYSLKPGEITKLEFMPKVECPGLVLVFFESPEAQSAVEKRELGAKIVKISLGKKPIELKELKTEVDLRESDKVVTIPGYWKCADIFDVEHYRSQLNDRPIYFDELTHYLLFGWKEGLSPNSFFDANFYTNQIPTIRKSTTNPFIHYASVGRVVGLPQNLSEARRKTMDSVDARDATDTTALWEIGQFLKSVGMGQNLDISTFNKLIISMFDPEYYAKNANLNPKLSKAELFARYLFFDYDRGVSPGPTFDEAHYRKLVKKKFPREEIGENALKHWVTFGTSNKISPTPLFDEEVYLEFNLDLQSYPNWLFEHWINHGRFEGRRLFRHTIIANGHFDPKTSTDSADITWFVKKFGADERAIAELTTNEKFLVSDLFEEIVEDAIKIDPNSGEALHSRMSFSAPFFDSSFFAFQAILEQIGAKKYDCIVTMPFCKMGGADYVAGTLANSLVRLGQSVLVLRTEMPDFDRPDWFDEKVVSHDISKFIGKLPQVLKERALYEVIRSVGPKHVFNVNSRLAYDTFVRFGKRLNYFTKFSNYYFCADMDQNGIEVGYPIWYFSPIIGELSFAMFDSNFLEHRIKDRYLLDTSLQAKLKTIYSPFKSEDFSDFKLPIVKNTTKKTSKSSKPRILWAGRLDRQKRFDLVIDIAKELPDVQFECWGKAVLDEPPKLDELPENMVLNGSFSEYKELPLNECDGWLYTSLWDGIPTIMIQIAGAGIPIVASGVGGVPELIEKDEGWILPVDATLDDYVNAIKDMLKDKEERIKRASKLAESIGKKFKPSNFDEKLKQILEIK